MSAFEHPMTCPHCGAKQPLAQSALPNDDSGPQDGDASLCFDCGLVSLFDASSPGGARLPTAQEQAEMEADPGIAMLRMGWVLRDIDIEVLYGDAPA